MTNVPTLDHWQPASPVIPNDFTWVGYYRVPDLGIEVPFTWHGAGGDFQMVAGGEGYPIHFTNVLFSGQLYTLTYRWPGVPRRPCTHVGPFTLEELNEGFARSSYVGRETLHLQHDFVVDHFRSVAVANMPIPVKDDSGEDIPVRIPVMSGDIYVDAGNPTQLRQLLHFGLQNLYDPNLDEWIVIIDASDAPGKVDLPAECRVGG